MSDDTIIRESGNELNFNSVMGFISQYEKKHSSFDHVVKMHFLRNFTIEPIEPFIKFHFYRSHIKPIVSYSNYDGIKQEILEKNSQLTTIKPDLIVLSLFNHVNDFFKYSSLNDLTDEIMSILEMLKENTSGLIIVNTQIPSFYASLIQHADDLHGIPSCFPTLNQVVKQYIAQFPSRFVLLDWERYIRLRGEEQCMDYRYWYKHKAPFKMGFLNLYAADIARVAKVIKGKAKKCLILDCDNTLWGGVIGEDGINGIQLDHYEYPGKIFYDFQQLVLSYYKQGVVIALCSKNNPEDVWDVLDKHPSCLLKRHHISAFRINWEDKSTNIASLAKELNLGLDSFVFVDDSKVECGLVKNFLPEVTVLEVPEDLFSYPPLLQKEHLFDNLTLSKDDKERTVRYQEENSRREYASKFESLDDYLASLELKLTIHPIEDIEISRVAQLTQKTNQFNLSVKRYTESDIKMLAGKNDFAVFSLRVADRFGDYGLTGALIACLQEQTVTIDSLLLSCRILSRRVEYAFLTHCLNVLKERWKINRWHAEFLPTDRNMQVKDFLLNTGFSMYKEMGKYHIYALEGMPKCPMIDFISIQ